jgi:hypothetical protein
MKALVACLNLAARLDDRITNTKAWKLSALPDATEARNVILTDDQVRSVVAGAYGIEHAFGLLVETLAVTGPRVSQAARLSVGDLLLVHRFRGSNHIRQLCRAYRTKYGRQDGD